MPHAWVLYVAALAPALAIAFAFSLGPSPAKLVANLRTADEAEARAILEGWSEEALPALVEELRRPNARHRVLIAKKVEGLSQDGALSEEVRLQARMALDGVEGSRPD